MNLYRKQFSFVFLFQDLDPVTAVDIKQQYCTQVSYLILRWEWELARAQCMYAYTFMFYTIRYIIMTNLAIFAGYLDIKSFFNLSNKLSTSFLYQQTNKLNNFVGTYILKKLLRLKKGVVKRKKR